MKKIKIALSCAVLCCLLITGCSDLGGASAREFKPVQSSIFVGRDGSIQSAVIETYTEGDYDQAEMQAMAESVLSAHNLAQGAAEAGRNEEGAAKLPAAVKSCTVGEGKAALIYEFASGSDLVKFARENDDETIQLEEISAFTVSEGLVQGSLLDGNFIKVKDGSSVSNDTVTSKSDWTAVAVTGPAVIVTEGKIQYVTQGVTVTDNFTVSTPEGKSYIVFK